MDPLPRSLDDIVDDHEYFKVETPDDYYQKELDAYCHWRFAWGREIGQNSLDAGAKLITIKVTEAESIQKNPDSQWTDSTCWVEWTDDGCGMDRDDGEGNRIVFSKFLVLGASKKKKGDAGGFGWAKKLICFAMIEWHIRTGTLHIHGKGGTYWIERNLEHVDGTHMRIRVPAAAYSIRSQIARWLYWTDTKGCKVMMDNEEIPTFSSIPVKGERATGVDWAKLIVTEVPGRDIIIRANGQMMSKMTGGVDQKYSVIIEVIGKSKDYFTSNRDTLRYDSRKEIASFLHELFKNPNRISKLEKPIVSTYRGMLGSIKIGSAGEGFSLGLDPAALIELLGMMESIGDSSDIVHDGFDIQICNEMEGSKVPERFLPGTWTPENILLMAQFCAIIKFIGEVVGYSGSITPGWFFSTDAHASWSPGYMLLNPVDIDDKTWEITDRFDGSHIYSDWNAIVKSVIHEFVHAAGCSYHDTDFTSTIGDYIALVLDNAEDLQTLRDSFYA